MNESKKRFVEQLLAADPPSPDARGRYEKEVRAMLESKRPLQRRLGRPGTLMAFPVAWSRHHVCNSSSRSQA
jgi:hypothetical protein